MEFKINEKLKLLRKGKGLTQEELAAKLHINLSTYQKYERDKQFITPSLENLVKLAEFFNVSTDFLLCRTDNKNMAEISVKDVVKKESAKPIEAAEFKTRFDRLPEALQELFRMAITYCVEDEDLSAEDGMARAISESHIKDIVVTLPLSAAKAAASETGGGVCVDDNTYELCKFYVPADARRNARQGISFVVKIRGDSMTPTYQDGDYVLVDTSVSVLDGEIGVFVVDGDGYIKRFDKAAAMLRSDNPDAGTDIPFDADTQIVGSVICSVDICTD